MIGRRPWCRANVAMNEETRLLVEQIEQFLRAQRARARGGASTPDERVWKEFRSALARVGGYPPRRTRMDFWLLWERLLPFMADPPLPGEEFMLGAVVGYVLGMSRAAEQYER